MPSDDKAWTREPGNPLWIKSRAADSDSKTPTPNFGSPMTRRKIINQSPALSDSGSEPQKYRTPPQTPFQPGFYKAPNTDNEPPTNPFPLSPKTARKITKEKSSESIASSGSTSSISKKMRRKKREEKRMGPGASANASDSDNNDEEL